MVPETMVPETRYTSSGDVTIAYQLVENGSIDLVVLRIRMFKGQGSSHIIEQRRQ
jgi:hypothetical protein